MKNLIQKMQYYKWRKLFLFIPLWAVFIFSVLATLFSRYSDIIAMVFYFMGIISAGLVIINTIIVLYSDIRYNFAIFTPFYGTLRIRHGDKCKGIYETNGRECVVNGIFYDLGEHKDFAIIKSETGDLYHVRIETLRLLF